MSSIDFFQQFGRSIGNIKQHENRLETVDYNGRTFSLINLRHYNKWRGQQLLQERKLAKYSDECEAEVRLVNAMINYEKYYPIKIRFMQSVVSPGI